MSNYGNNITAIATHGRLIYVDESAGEDIAGTDFDNAVVAGRDSFLDFFGIDGIYRPGVLSRSIRYIPKYIEDDNLSPGSRHNSPILTIKCPNSQTLGITAEEFETSHTVSIAPRKGMDTRQFRMLRIVRQSAAWVTYEVK